jgi:two-component system response regulator ResD
MRRKVNLMVKPLVLVVDDEWNMRNLLRIYLLKNDIDILEASNGLEALKLLDLHQVDLILLDVMMPDMSGWEVCSKVRGKWNIPIMMLTARSETKDIIQGLNLGADDYLAKPFDTDELIARVFALLRRSSPNQSTIVQSKTLEFPEMTIYPERRECVINGYSLDLTQKEFDMLLLLSENIQRAYTRELLLQQIWGEDFFGDVRTIDTHIKNIRLKLDKAGLSYSPIQTVWGIGYKFTPSGAI